MFGEPGRRRGAVAALPRERALRASDRTPPRRSTRALARCGAGDARRRVASTASRTPTGCAARSGSSRRSASGERLWIVPTWHEPPDPARDQHRARSGRRVRHRQPSDDAPVPALARARACAPATRVLDYGCGSGILAIAAMKLGAGAGDARRHRPAGARGRALQCRRATASRSRSATRSTALPGPASHHRRQHPRQSAAHARARSSPRTRAPAARSRSPGSSRTRPATVIEAYAPWAASRVDGRRARLGAASRASGALADADHHLHPLPGALPRDAAAAQREAGTGALRPLPARSSTASGARALSRRRHRRAAARRAGGRSEPRRSAPRRRRRRRHPTRDSSTTSCPISETRRRSGAAAPQLAVAARAHRRSAPQPRTSAARSWCSARAAAARATPSRAWAFGVALLALVLAARSGLRLSRPARAALPGAAPVARVGVRAAAAARVPWSREDALLKLEDSELLEVPGRPSEIALGARIRNLAPVAQEYPHLELTLTDLTRPGGGAARAAADRLPRPRARARAR